MGRAGPPNEPLSPPRQDPDDAWPPVGLMHHSLRDADPLDYSALMLPGGVVSADELRTVWAAHWTRAAR